MYRGGEGVEWFPFFIIHVACIQAIRNVNRILVEKPERQRSRRRWKDNIKIQVF
jgi:hypothetical protein